MTNQTIRQKLRPFSLFTASMALACAATGAQAATQDTSSPATASSSKQTGTTTTPGTGSQEQDLYNHSADTSHDVTHVTASPMNVLHESIGLSRMPQDAMHTPQNVNVVPQVLMQQQNVKSLDEALKNVPGITASVGEGEGGMAGDQFLIRGFAAQNDIYENGLRDFGVYTRDSFYYDHVSVIKGPSSEVFGNGTTGGAINIVTKTPHLGNSYQASFSGGSGSYYRGTLDVNYQLNSTTESVRSSVYN